MSKTIKGRKCEVCKGLATYAVGDFRQVKNSSNFKLIETHYFCDNHKRERKIFYQGDRDGKD